MYTLKKSVIIISLLVFALTANADKWALVIGINNYKSITPDLRYCESDALKMKEFLVQKARFDERNIKILLSEQATKKKIRESVTNWLAKNVKPDDRVVIYFSGHGVQCTDYDGDEKDRLDEMLCAYDSIRLDFTFIKDDELSRWLRTINTNDKIVILDCCHSGTGTKAVNLSGEDVPTVKAYYPESEMNIQKATKADIARYLESENEAEMEVKAMEEQESEKVDGVASISGCRDDQVAMESPVLEGGVLTYYLTKTLNNLTDQNKVITVYEAWKSAKNEIRRKNWQQEPQFDGNQNIPIVGDENILREEPFDATITSVSGGLFRISAGETKSVTRGSIYAVYSKYADKPTGKPKAKVRIAKVLEKYSEATIIDGQKVEEGDKVIEESHYIETEDLLVRVEPFSSDFESKLVAQNTIEEIKKAIEKIEHVVLTEKRQAPDLIIQGNVAKTDSGELDISVRLVKVNVLSSTRPVSVRIKEPKQVHDAVFKKFFADPKDEFGNPIKDENGQPIPGFAKVLKRHYIIKSLAKLENPNPGFKINLSIDKGSQAVYKPGEVVSISMEPTKDCYVYLLDIGTSGTISLLFPNRWQSNNYIQAGKKFVIDSYDENGEYKIQVYPPPGEERIKAIATTTPIPLEKLTPDNINSPVQSFTDNASAMIELTVKDLRIKPINKWAVEDVFFRISNYSVYEDSDKEPLELGILE